jgi:hypothetical protein
MSMFSGIFSNQINWDKATSEQKLAALPKLPPNDPVLEPLALGDTDEPVRHAAIALLSGDALLRLVGAVKAGDEACLAARLGETLDGGVMSSSDTVAKLLAASAPFRVELASHTRIEALALALLQSLDNDADRARVARGKGAIDARIAAVRELHDVDTLEAIAHDYRDKQRGIYRAARDRADQLVAAREVERVATHLCDRLEGLLTRHELTTTAFTTAEREWAALVPSPAQDAVTFAALQARHAALTEQARGVLREQAETWRDAERLKAAIADVAARSEADAAVEADAFAALVAEREALAAKLSQPGMDTLHKERDALNAALGRLAERHAILGIESTALAKARQMVEALRAAPEADRTAMLTPAWREEFARGAAIVRTALRAGLEAEVLAAQSALDAVSRQQADAQRAVEQQYRGEIEALVKQLEQLLDKGQHQLANEADATLKEKLAAERPAGVRPVPAALDFRIKRCHERLAKMNEWKRFAAVQAREALCREAEALAQRVTRQEKARVAKNEQPAWPWPVGEQVAEPVVAAPVVPQVPAQPAWAWPVGEPLAVDAAAEAAAEAAPQAEADQAVGEVGVATNETTASDTATATPDAAEAAAADAAPQDVLPMDAIASSVRELQARWQALDKGQGTSPKGLWERFRRACDRAYGPVKRHYEEQEKHRAENAEKKNAVLDKLAALNERIADGADWGRLLNERGELVKSWFAAGPLPRKSAKAMQKRFDDLTGTMDAKLNARRSAERTRRRALIDQAKAIAERPADGGSMAAMIALQKQWQDGMRGAIRLKANEDQRLWDEFRAAGTALFGKRDAEKAAKNSERNEQVGARRELINEMQALANLDDAAAIRRGIDDVGSRWNALPWPDRRPLRDVEQKFSNARTAANARIAAIRGEQEALVRAAAAERMAVVERAEQALAAGNTPDIAALRTEIEGMLAEGDKLDAGVVTRLAALQKAAAAGPDAWRAQVEKTQAERDALLMELEIVLDLPSPAALAADRRMRMLKRLAESKNSRSTPPLMAADAAKAVEKLLAMPMATQGVEARVQAVVKAAGTRRK